MKMGLRRNGLGFVFLQALFFFCAYRFCLFPEETTSSFSLLVLSVSSVLLVFIALILLFFFVFNEDVPKPPRSVSLLAVGFVACVSLVDAFWWPVIRYTWHELWWQTGVTLLSVFVAFFYLYVFRDDDTWIIFKQGINMITSVSGQTWLNLMGWFFSARAVRHFRHHAFGKRKRPTKPWRNDQDVKQEQSAASPLSLRLAPVFNPSLFLRSPLLDEAYSAIAANKRQPQREKAKEKMNEVEETKERTWVVNPSLLVRRNASKFCFGELRKRQMDPFCVLLHDVVGPVVHVQHPGSKIWHTYSLTPVSCNNNDYDKEDDKARESRVVIEDKFIALRRVYYRMERERKEEKRRQATGNDTLGSSSSSSSLSDKQKESKLSPTDKQETEQQKRRREAWEAQQKKQKEAEEEARKIAEQQDRQVEGLVAKGLQLFDALSRLNKNFNQHHKKKKKEQQEQQQQQQKDSNDEEEAGKKTNQNKSKEISKGELMGEYGLTEEVIVRLEMAQVLVAPSWMEEEEERWKRKLERARMQMDTRGWTVLADLLPPLQLEAFRCYCNKRKQEEDINPSINGYNYKWSDSVASMFNSFFTPVIQRIIEEQILPIQSLILYYDEGSFLDLHVDWHPFAFSLSYAIDCFSSCSSSGSSSSSSSSTTTAETKRAAWPLSLISKQEDAALIDLGLAFGEAVLFKGQELPHYRDRLPAGNSVISVSFSWDRKERLRGTVQPTYT
ncbi:hypothetical protein QOT17_019389 [Balamuthia mandrillaris]